MGIQNQKGSSLVEVMVALFVLAIGLLGVLAMQSKSMQYNQSAHVYSQAVYLANDMAERIRSNIKNTISYSGTIPETAPTIDCSVTPCDAAGLAAWDKFVWNENVKKALPSGKGEITPSTGVTPAHLKVTVSFDDSRSDGKLPGETGYGGAKTYSLVVEIPQ